MKLRILIILMSAAMAATAQPQASPCQEAAFRQFDFWIGDWTIGAELRPPGSDSWQPNTTWIMTRVYPDLDGCALIEESIDLVDGDTLVIGKSITAYNQLLKQYQQTWVDRSGNVWEYVGSMHDNEMVLMLEPSTSSGQRMVAFKETTLIRMVFKDITSDGLTWAYEYSTDEGNSWTATNRAVYKRINPGQALDEH